MSEYEEFIIPPEEMRGIYNGELKYTIGMDFEDFQDTIKGIIERKLNIKTNVGEK